MILKFYEYIKEWKDYKDETDLYTVWNTYDEIYREELFELVRNVTVKNLKKQPWKTAPFPRIKKIWNDWARLNFIRDEKGMNMIADIVITNIVKLDINTMLCGHTPYNPVDELEELDIIFKEKDEKEEEFLDPKQLSLFKEFTDEREENRENKRREKEYREPITYEDFDERLNDYLYDENWGQLRISDFALKPLQELASDLMLAKTPEEKLLLCDRVFNIVHPRGDIASLFVKGGSKKLSELSGENYQY